MVFQNLDFRSCGVATLTTEQRDEFERLGIVQLPGPIARADAEVV
jgi:hypothetical protein